MFYSPELLQRRQGAFGTIWLAATLGARSSFKKLQRKDVLSIDVTSACELVKAPPEPLALRLSSHLLFGISRVYSQQYELFYTDLASAHNRMRREMQTNPEGLNAVQLIGRSRPDQLVLPEDPFFVPDLALSHLGPPLPALGGSELSMALMSSLNPNSRSSLSYEFPSVSAISLDRPGADTSRTSDFPAQYQQDKSLSDNFDNVLPPVDFTFGEDGELRDLPTPILPGAGRQLPIYPSSGSLDIREMVRREHESGQRFDPGTPINLAEPLPSAEPFNIEAMGIAAVTPTPSEKGEVKVAQVRAKRKIPKLVTLDQTIELKRTKLAEWRDGYLTNMEAARAAKDHREAEKIAKGDAEIWVWGFGIFSNVPPNCPLFSQSFLKNLVLGKRDGDAEDTERPAKTRRISNLEGQDSEQEFGRNAPHVPFQDDNQDYGADDIEVGREQEASAAGGSSMMPWNQISSRTLRFGSSELQSMQQGRDGSSAAVSILNTPLASSRRVSGIRGRGLSSKRSDDFANVALQPLTSVDDDVEELLQEDPGEDFEVFRNGTSNDNANLDDNVDSQNMDTQLLLASMERESYNFFEYLKMELEQRSSSSIFMSELVPPTSSRAIAAQAFHHSLQLATKSLISLHQNPNSMEIVFQLAE